MRLCKLRIAWSIVWSIVCVLSIVMWVRSYWRLVVLENRIGSQPVQISSVKGRVAFAKLDPRAATGKFYLNVVSGDSADWRKKGKSGFTYHDDGSAAAFIAPHWFLAVLSAAIAGTPWISRSWRFTIRTLLIATTLLSILLRLIVELR